MAWALAGGLLGGAGEVGRRACCRRGSCLGRLGRLLIPEALNKLVQILECCLTGVDNVMPLSKVMGVTRLVRMLLRFSADD